MAALVSGGKKQKTKVKRFVPVVSQSDQFYKANFGPKCNIYDFLFKIYEWRAKPDTYGVNVRNVA